MIKRPNRHEEPQGGGSIDPPGDPGGDPPRRDEDAPVPEDLTNVPGLEGDPPGNRRLRWTLGVLAAAAGAVGIAWLSQVPYTVHGDDAGMLRLSWRMAGEALEECRPLAPEEARARPEHMTRDEVCQERIPPHRLRLQVDGRTKVDRLVEPGGIRGDRPFFIHEDMLLEPEAQHRVEVTFGPDEEAVERMKEEAAAEGVEMTPARDGGFRERALERSVEVGPREIALVTLADDGELVVRLADPREGLDDAAGQSADGGEGDRVPRRTP